MILWPLIAMALAAQTWWTYRGQSSPWFLPTEVALGAANALLWGMLAVTTRCNHTLFIYGLVWDVLYTGIMIGVPWLCFGVRVPLETWFWIGWMLIGVVGVRWSMGTQP